MAQKSSIETQLSDEDKNALNKMIASGQHTLDSLLGWLRDMGYGISRSALGRHSQKVEAVGAKLRESRAMTEALVKELGPDITEGKQGRLLVEVLRSLVFDHLSKQMDAGEGDDGFEAGDFFFLAKALKEMASANKIDLDRELKIREDAEKKAKVAAAEAIEQMAQEENEKGLSRDTVEAIKARILGVKVDKGGA